MNAKLDAYAQNIREAAYEEGYKAAKNDYNLISAETVDDLVDEAYHEGMYDVGPYEEWVGVAWGVVGVMVGVIIGVVVF